MSHLIMNFAALEGVEGSNPSCKQLGIKLVLILYETCERVAAA